MEKKQYQWLKKKLGKSNNTDHIILFCHFPFFKESFDEAETYSNISLEKRKIYFELFEESNVNVIFAGHLHGNATAKYGQIEMITTSALGKPLRGDPSGFRIVKVYNDHIDHHYYGLDEVPATIMFD